MGHYWGHLAKRLRRIEDERLWVPHLPGYSFLVRAKPHLVQATVREILAEDGKLQFPEAVQSGAGGRLCSSLCVHVPKDCQRVLRRPAVGTLWLRLGKERRRYQTRVCRGRSRASGPLFDRCSGELQGRGKLSKEPRQWPSNCGFDHDGARSSHSRVLVVANEGFHSGEAPASWNQEFNILCTSVQV